MKRPENSNEVNEKRKAAKKQEYMKMKKMFRVTSNSLQY